MDFLQEDVDSMQMELSMWKNSYANSKLELKREEGYVYTNLKFQVWKFLFYRVRGLLNEPQNIHMQTKQKFTSKKVNQCPQNITKGIYCHCFLCLNLQINRIGYRTTEIATGPYRIRY